MCFFSNLDYGDILELKGKNLVDVVNIKFSDKARVETCSMTDSIQRRAFLQVAKDPERSTVVRCEPWFFYPKGATLKPLKREQDL